MRQGRVVVLGVLGQSPFAGVSWQVMHYLEGLRRLEFEVFYVEDTGEWPYDPIQNTVTADCGYATDHISDLLGRCGLQDRWAYRNAAEGGRVYGLSEKTFSAVFSDADLLINLTGATVLREEHLRVPVRLYLETDPVMPQIEVALGQQFTVDFLEAHTHWASFGENLGASDCLVPMGRFPFLATRQPVVLDWWHPSTGSATPPSRSFTTIASWQQSGKDIDWQGERYTWSKHHEFLKIIDLPRYIRTPIELALACGDPAAVTLLREHGWSVRDALTVSSGVDPYRNYIRASAGEFTVAKDQNVRMRSGWFSDRSACYLAAGKPVVTQDTGFGALLPTGAGLFAFRTLDDVRLAFEELERDPERHRRAARKIAVEYFAAEKVISNLLSSL